MASPCVECEGDERTCICDEDLGPVENGRHQILDETYGQLKAVHLITHGLTTRFQVAALHNQFVNTDLTPDEITEINKAGWEISMAVAKALDTVSAIYNKEQA